MSKVLCLDFSISMHALKAMIQRNILVDEVLEIVNNGEVIAEYLNDKPYPSYLMLHFINERPLHIVVAQEENGNCIVVTAYQPKQELWNNKFTKKIK